MVTISQLDSPEHVRLSIAGVKLGDMILILPNIDSMVDIDFTIDDNIEEQVFAAYDVEEYNDDHTMTLNGRVYSMTNKTYVAVMSELVEYITETTAIC